MRLKQLKMQGLYSQTFFPYGEDIRYVMQITIPYIKTHEKMK